jgi:hypothetical protein
MMIFCKYNTIFGKFGVSGPDHSDDRCLKTVRLRMLFDMHYFIAVVVINITQTNKT